MRNAKSSIYMIKNPRTGDVYIGSTSMPIERRWQNHQSDLRCNRHPNYMLQKHADEYGLDVFVFTKLRVCRKNEKTYWESVYIEQYLATYNVKMNSRKRCICA